MRKLLLFLSLLLGSCKTASDSAALLKDSDSGQPTPIAANWWHGEQQNPSFAHRATLASFNHQNEVWIEASIRARSSQPGKEYWSLRHQQDLLRFARFSALQRAAQDGLFEAEIYRMGVMDSDKGKLASYTTLLTTAESGGDIVHKSNFLIRTMQLQEVTIDGVSNRRAIQGLQSLLVSYFGRAKPLFNPLLHPNEVRRAIRSNPILLGWMHEWPGASDAMEIVARGALDPTVLEKVLRVSLFHNGPDEGFWGFLTHNLLSKVLNEEGKGLFVGTVFYGDNQGFTPVYKIPRSLEGILHVAMDRLSQATRGGFVKIWYELKDNPKETPATFVKNVIENGIAGTLDQLAALKEHAQQGSAFMTVAQRELALNVIDLAVERIRLVRSHGHSNLSAPDHRDNLEEFTKALQDWADQEDRVNGEAIEYVARRL